MKFTHTASVLRYLRYSLLWLLAGGGYTAVQGQNLVPNGDFELYNACPYTFSSIDYSPSYTSFSYVQDWVRPLDLGTPDYFRGCSTITDASVPKNFAGYQPAHSGVAYAGLIGFYGFDPNPSNSLRELITTKFITPMMKDSAYCVKFYVSPSHIPSSTTKAVALNEIGAHFSDTMPYSPTGYYSSLPYHILNDTARHLTDTTAWYEIGGIYIAHGGEEFMTIGCFKRSNLPATTPPSTAKDYSYDYLDDVSVVKTSPQRTVNYIRACDSMKNGSLFLSSTLGAGLYEWSSGEKTRSIRVSQPGNYYCKAYIGCAVFLDSFYVVGDSFYTMVNVRACDSNKISTTLSASEATGRYRWNTGDTNRQLLVTRAGDYTCVTLSGCKVITDSFHFIVEMPTIPLVHDTIICQYSPPPVLTVYDTGLVWFTEPGGIAYSEEQPLITTDKPRRITLYLAKKGGDCTGPKAAVNITIQNKPEPQPPVLILHCEGLVDSNLVLGVPVPADVVYTWNTGETVCCINIVQDGRYVRVAANGCGTAIDTFTLRAEPCQYCIEFPTAFTPNGDHRNDRFGALIRCPVARYNMSIFNRWGACIYTTSNKDDDWDGSYKGGEAPMGTYMYMASMVNAITGKEIFVKGAVVLIR